MAAVVFNINLERQRKCALPVDEVWGERRISNWTWDETFSIWRTDISLSAILMSCCGDLFATEEFAPAGSERRKQRITDYTSMQQAVVLLRAAKSEHQWYLFPRLLRRLLRSMAAGWQ